MKKVKIIQSMSSEKKVERKVNEFLARDDVRVLEIQYKPTSFYFSVLIVYEER